jgi:hypothetical protein
MREHASLSSFLGRQNASARRQYLYDLNSWLTVRPDTWSIQEEVGRSETRALAIALLRFRGTLDSLMVSEQKEGGCA